MREFDLIRKITGFNASLPDAVTIPPGDDMAAIRLGDQQLLIAVDQIIDQVHFDCAQASLEQIGRKAVTRNLSDVAAMAGKPLAALVAAALPRGMKTADAERLLDALRQTAERYGCPLIGGDTGAHDGPLTMSVTILAEPAGIEPVLRSGATLGDAIYVTGQLGGSCFEYEGRVHHLDFEPRVELARQLASNAETRPTAMIDLSDGLARDLPHLVAGAEVHAHALPVSAVARQHALRDAKPGWLHAVADGEDYELLFTAKPDAPIPSEIAGVRVTRVGRVVEAPGIVLIEAGERTPIEGLGWEHHG
jgi:thiamine-monophosphate kinase